MPVYDYLCAKCGPFTDMRPMVESSLPLGCPGCGKKAPRAFLTAPYFATASPQSWVYGRSRRAERVETPVIFRLAAVARWWM